MFGEGPLGKGPLSMVCVGNFIFRGMLRVV